MLLYFIDIDECANDEKICGSDIEICLNELPPIQYTCVCKSGYSGGTGNCEGENKSSLCTVVLITLKLSSTIFII